MYTVQVLFSGMIADLRVMMMKVSTGFQMFALFALHLLLIYCKYATFRHAITRLAYIVLCLLFISVNNYIGFVHVRYIKLSSI